MDIMAGKQSLRVEFYQCETILTKLRTGMYSYASFFLVESHPPQKLKGHRTDAPVRLEVLVRLEVRVSSRVLWPNLEARLTLIVNNRFLGISFS